MPRKFCAAAGAQVSFSQYGDHKRNTLVLLHCGGGHGEWWAELLPTLVGEFHVVTIDLSGHGESERRLEYEPELWADEVRDIILNLGEPTRAVTIAGHSMGGLVGIYVAARYPTFVGDLILVDPPLQHVRLRDMPARSKIYAVQDDALKRFNLSPPETIASRERLIEVARKGLKQIPEGWTWKHDPHASQRFTVSGVASELARVQCRISCVYGERSQYVDHTTVAYIESITGRPVKAVVIPGAYHHIPLDSPVELAKAICDAQRPACA